MIVKILSKQNYFSNYHKFVGIAPEGFTLVPNELLEELKDFDTWKEFKNTLLADGQII